MAENPVCKMAIERGKAAAQLEFQGVTYCLCSQGCRAEFEAAVRP